MSTVDEYHKLARDCLRWAARARAEEQRKRLLNLAHDWTQAASGLEGASPSPGTAATGGTPESSGRGVSAATPSALRVPAARCERAVA
jgi:hypothetical protein